MVKTIFSDLERKYIKNPLSIGWKERGIIKIRLSKKISPENINEILNDLYLIFNFSKEEKVKKKIIKKLFLKEKVRKEIVKKLFLNLKLSSVKEISTIYNNFEKEKNKRLELIKKEEDEETIKRQIKFFEECPFSLCLFYIKHVKPILNAKKFEDSLHNFLNHPKSILSNKFTSDMKYICSSKLTKEIYHKIKRYKEPIKIKNLLSDFKFKREEEIIKEFYIRGILLEDSISWETFLELCQNLIKKGKFTRNIKSDWIEYDLDVFKVNKDYKEKEVVLPKIYENIDFEFYSPPDLKETKF